MTKEEKKLWACLEEFRSCAPVNEWNFKFMSKSENLALEKTLISLENRMSLKNTNFQGTPSPNPDLAMIFIFSKTRVKCKKWKTGLKIPGYPLKPEWKLKIWRSRKKVRIFKTLLCLIQICVMILLQKNKKMWYYSSVSSRTRPSWFPRQIHLSLSQVNIFSSRNSLFRWLS